MSIPRGYVPNHKFWDRMGRITPNVEWSESHRPHFESIPAPWLPVQRYEKEYEYYFVISAGKVVGLDRQGNLVPAGLRKAWNVATTTTVLSYTATDVTENVIDLTTGALLTATASYTEAELTAALKERGLIRPDERAMDFISKPIGVASYNYYKAAGPNHYNPADLYQHNFRPQALAAVTCDYAVTYPVVPSAEASETMDGDLANLAGSIDWSSSRTGGWFGSTAINGLVKYSSLVADDADVVCYVMAKFPIAHITEDTPISVDTGGLVNQVNTVTAVSAAGDYFIDYDLGLLFVYEAGGDAIPSPFTTSSVLSYYHYESELNTGSTLTTYAFATGNLDYGDLLTYDVNSNLIKATLDISDAEGYAADFSLFSTDPEYDTETDNSIVSVQLEQAISNYQNGIVGQILGTVEHPKDYLDRVKTAYNGQTAANLQTPGSATGGRTDQLTYTNSGEKMVIVNLIHR